tara:strand:- start:2980 stop:3480 length:501 start_codon:yes stop_codon:yes gene_type:complete
LSDTIEAAVEKALDKKHMPVGVVRPVDKNILRMYMLGARPKEIAHDMGLGVQDIYQRLNNPAVKRELARLDIITDRELIKLIVVSKRRMLEASLEAADKLVEMMGDEEVKDGLKLKAIVKVLEYSHGKPKQSVVVSPGNEGGQLPEADVIDLDSMIESVEGENDGG